MRPWEWGWGWLVDRESRGWGWLVVTLGVKGWGWLVETLGVGNWWREWTRSGMSMGIGESIDFEICVVDLNSKIHKAVLVFH